MIQKTLKPDDRSFHFTNTIFGIVLLVVFAQCFHSISFAEQAKAKSKFNQMNKEAYKTAVFGTGCFWCTEAVFEQIEGVKSAVSGYMGGHAPNPSYKDVSSGKSGYAEVIKITYDPQKLNYKDLLSLFWRSHDPTTLNRQGADVGTQYRSVIFYNSPEQKKLAEDSKREFAPAYKKPIVTEISPASTFYKAEVSHQDYYARKPNSAYCRFVIAPKLKKLKLKH